MNVFVFGINYAPEHTGIAPYTTALAEFLAGRGDRVTVFTGQPHYPQWRVAPADRVWRPRSEDRNGVRVVRLPHHVPARQSALRRGVFEASFAASSLAAGLGPRHVDTVVAVVPNLLSAVGARIHARRTGARFVVWVQDSMAAAAGQSGLDSKGRLARGLAAVEEFVLRGADSVVVVASDFERHVAERGVPRDRIRHIPNWVHVTPSSADRTATRAELGWRPDEVIALHAGNMGLKQGLTNVVDASAVSSAAGSPVRFVLMGDGNQRSYLEEYAAASPEAAVDFLTPAPQDRFMDILSAADVLVVNEALSVRDMSLPSKLTSYFTAGRPVLAAVAADGSTAKVVERSQAGRVVSPGDPQALHDHALVLADDPDAAARMGRAGQAFAAAELSPQRALADLARAVDGS